MGCILLLQAGCEDQTLRPRELNPNWFKQQTWAVRGPSGRVPAPRIVFEKVTHDFGNVGPGTNQLCEFRFTNTGDDVLTIGEITKTCGCTPFSLEKTEYAPGESGSLKVRYYAESQYGDVTKNLFVHSNDRRSPKVGLTVKARVIMKVRCEPRTLSLSLKYQNAGCPPIALTSIDNQPFSIRNFKSTANCITADFNPSVKATKFVLQPRVNMETLEKTLNGRIEIGLTHPECKMVTLNLNALPRYRINPRSIVVQGARAKQPVVRKVRILNNYKEDFELESALSKKDIVKILSHKKFGNGYELELQITPPSSGGRVFTETFEVNLKDGKKLEIPLNGFYSRTVAQPRMSTRSTRSLGGTTLTTRTAPTAPSNNKEECDDCGKVFYFEPAKNKPS
jgi:hypothetical protein